MEIVGALALATEVLPTARLPTAPELPELPVSPVLPVLPVSPVLPVLPVSPVLPVLPVSPSLPVSALCAGWVRAKKPSNAAVARARAPGRRKKTAGKEDSMALKWAGRFGRASPAGAKGQVGEDKCPMDTIEDFPPRAGFAR